MKKTSPRKEAIANGDRWYRSGKNCINEHENPERSTKNGTCRICNDAANARYREKSRKTKLVQRANEPPGKKKRPGPSIGFKEARITPEEIEAESFKEMAQRIYDRGQTW